MIDDLAEVMYAMYEGDLDITINLPSRNMVEYRIYEPHQKFENYLSVFLHTSNQTKGYYADLTIQGIETNRINFYSVPDLLREWNKNS